MYVFWGQIKLKKKYEQKLKVVFFKFRRYNALPRSGLQALWNSEHWRMRISSWLILICFREEKFHDKRRNHKDLNRLVPSGSRNRIFFIPDPGSGSKNLSISTQKLVFMWALGNMIRVVHPGSGCWCFTHPGARIQGSKRQHCSSLFIYDKKNTDLSPSKVRSLPESLSVRDSISFSIRACAVRSKCCPYS